MKNIRKQIGIFFLIIMAACVLFFRVDGEAASAKISINKTRYVLPKGKQFKLKATILKSKYKERKIRWSSSRKSVAKVSKSGVVRARKKGTATITARISGTKYKVSCKIYVGIPVSAITIPDSSCQIEVGESYSIKAKILPTNATKKSISYSSSDSEVAKVSSGIVTGLKAGTATITLTSKDGHEVTNTFTVTVVEKKDADQENTAGTSDNLTNPDSSEDNPSGEIEEWTPSENVVQFLQLMEKYSAFIKQNAALNLIKRSGSKDVYIFAEAEKLIKAGSTVNVNCTSPMNWGLHEMGFMGSGNIYGGKNGFSVSSTNKASLSAQGTFIKSGDGIGMGFPQAAKAGYLKPGDMVAIYISSSTPNHSVVYKGLDENGNPMVYEAGGIAESKKYVNIGCGPINYNSYTNYKVTEIYRLN